MSKYPENITSFTPVELKLGIKSSLPNAKQAIALIYLLWKINPTQAECVYSLETAADLVLSDGMLDSIKAFLTQNGIDFNSETLSEKTKQNPLFLSQIEHLNVAFELIWKLGHFDFVGTMPFSAERSGGKRYAKKILFTANIDILDTTIESNKDEYLRVIYNWLIGVDVEVRQKKYEGLLTRLLTYFSEDAYFQIRNNASNILFRNYEMYKAVLSDSSAILDGEKSNNGPLRILCSSLKEGLNNYIVNAKEEGKNVAKRNDAVSESDFSAYCNRVENLLKASNRKIDEESDVSEANTDEGNPSLPIKPSQIIYYGVPGCGKSNKIKEDLKDVPEYNKIRVVFHPEYTNADFMGQILPVVNGGISYKFTPGPFAQIIKRAYLNPNDKFYLVIEEINRGNAAAIFGDTFQLLDRLKPGKTDSLGNDPASPNVNTFTEGWSQYFVQNIDVNDYIRNVVEDNGKYKEPSDLSNTSRLDIKIGSITFTKNTAIRLPPNLSIWATMNTSDQNVFTLDNAFQRRFDMQLIRNEFEKGEDSKQFGGYKDADVQTQHDAPIAGTSVIWGVFWEWINKKIVTTLKGLSSTEDKRLGVWFVSNVDGKIDKKVFAEKVLKYLWDDAFKFKRPQIFAPEIDTLERLIAAFENPEQGKNPFEVFKDFSNLVSLVAAPPQNNGAANQ